MTEGSEGGVPGPFDAVAYAHSMLIELSLLVRPANAAGLNAALAAAQQEAAAALRAMAQSAEKAARGDAA